MENTLSPMMSMALMFLLGIIVFAAGLFVRKRHKRLMLLCTEKTDGMVIDFASSVDIETENGKSRKSYTYFPIFRYMANGEEVTVQSSTGSGRKRFRKGQAVTVCYNPDNTAQWYVSEDKTAARGGIIIMAVGALFFAVGLLIPFSS